MNYLRITGTFLACMLMLIFATKIGFAFGGKNDNSKNPPGKNSSEKQRMNRLWNVDLFTGPAYITTKGQLLEYQKQYYETGTNELLSGGSFTTQMWLFQYGFQFRVAPFFNQKNALNQLSIGLGCMNNKKGFEHDFKIENKMVLYNDITRVNEKFRADYLSIPLSIRYGNRVYTEFGLCFDRLMGGQKTQIIKRATSEKVNPDGTITPHQPPFTTGVEYNYALTSKTMKTTVTGFIFGGGVHFTRYAGIRLLGHYNNGFFNDAPDLNQLLITAQVIFTIN